ncbi:MAG: hypothetical protein J0L77_09145 [Alphaproteobacteria bacterium]|nr:hypothetical protein [Alphaproteobacteria bacterium]
MSKAGWILGGLAGFGALAAAFSWAGDHGIKACEPNDYGGAKLHHSDGRITSVKQMTVSNDGRFCVPISGIFIPVRR